MEMPAARESVWSRFIGKFTIKNKLLITLAPIALGTLLVVLIMFYPVSFRETRALVTQQADVGMNQQTQLLDSYLDKLRTESEVFMFNLDVQKNLKTSKRSLDPTARAELEAAVRRSIYNMIVDYDTNVESVAIQTVHGDYYVWKMDSRLPYDTFIQRLNAVAPAARAQGGEMLFCYDRLDEGVVTLARSILDPVADKEIGVLMIDFNLGFLDSLLSAGAGGAGPSLIVANPAGSIIFNSSPFSPVQIAALAHTTEKLRAGGDSFRIRHTTASNGWDVLLVIDETLLYGNITRLVLLQIAVALGGMSLLIFAIYEVSRTISRQFKRFCKQISRITNPKNHALLQVTSHDEFLELARVYNSMMERIDKLIDAVYSKELLLRNSEIKAFQAQINPHFLYNTLDCVNGLAEANRPEDIKKTVTALASILRMSIKGEELLTVRESLLYTEQYLYIEKIRYGDKILFLCEIPESMMDYYMPKLTLQPLLENSIVHGISGRLGQGMIGLFGAEEPDALCFTVKDNGPGIPPAVLARFAPKPPGEPPASPGETPLSQESIGLQNIQSRIRLMYGEAYGLTLQNLPAGGACVTLRLPKLRRREPFPGNRPPKGGYLQ